MMELALSCLGDPSMPFSFLDETPKLPTNDLGFCMGLTQDEKRATSDPPLQLQLDLLPFSPVPRPQLAHNRQGPLGLEVNRLVLVSSSQMAFGVRNGSRRGKRELELEIVETEGLNARGSDSDDENGSTRKKLRLSKQQSAFLEQTFREHNTLNPKQKLALAKQLNLRPRQIEVWFQNRRARTKLKQTEVDCEYLKRCCETLAEKNIRLHKELQELRALKSSQPFYMSLPATTLTMCSSCERVATATAAPSSRKTEEYPFFSPTNA